MTWTKGMPEKPDYYWMRRGDKKEPVKVVGGLVRLIRGEESVLYPNEAVDYEFCPAEAPE